MGWMDKKQEDEITEMDAKDEAQPQQPEAVVCLYEDVLRW